MVANTWVAAGAGDWSDDANWSLGHSPIAGEDPTFDGTSVNNCAANDDTPTGVLTIAAGYSGTIAQSSDMYISGYSQAGGTLTGVPTKWVYCGGNFYRAGAAALITPSKLNLNLTGTGTITQNSYPDRIAKLTITGNYSLVNALYIDNKLTVNGYLNVGATALFSYYGSFFGAYGDGKVVSTTGYIQHSAIGVTTAYYFYADVGDCNFQFGNSMGGTSTSSNTLQTELNCKSVQWNGGASSFVSLNLNGHSLTASSITVGTRGILQCGEGTITTSSLDSSAGTITEETAKWIFAGAATAKLGVGQKLYSVISKSTLQLLADAEITHLFAHVNPVDLNGFVLTQAHPENEYTGLRRPIVIPVKKLDIGPVGLADGWLRDLGAVV